MGMAEFEERTRLHSEKLKRDKDLMRCKFYRDPDLIEKAFSYDTEVLEEYK